jgi:hypothetical protein
MGLHPSELSSYRLAVRRLRRRSPLDVGSTRHHLAHRSLVVRVPKHPRNRTSRPPRRTLKRPLGDLLRHSPRGQALEVPGARGARLRRNRNNGGAERTVPLLPRPEDHLGTERSRPALALRPEGRNETGSAARRLPKTEVLVRTRRRPNLPLASSKTEALVSASGRRRGPKPSPPPADIVEDRSPRLRPQQAVPHIGRRRGPKPSLDARCRPPFSERRLGPKPSPTPSNDATSAGCLRRPKPPSDRTCGRDGPESIVAFRGLIPAAIRHSHAGCLRRYVARSSHGLLPSRVFSLSAAVRPSPGHPLMGFSSRGANALRCDPPGF